MRTRRATHSASQSSTHRPYAYPTAYWTAQSRSRSRASRRRRSNTLAGRSSLKAESYPLSSCWTVVAPRRLQCAISGLIFRFAHASSTSCKLADKRSVAFFPSCPLTSEKLSPHLRSWPYGYVKDAMIRTESPNLSNALETRWPTFTTMMVASGGSFRRIWTEHGSVQAGGISSLTTVFLLGPRETAPSRPTIFRKRHFAASTRSF